MAQFPTLATGSVAQYPIAFGISFKNQIVTFLDGTEQRFRNSSSALNTWVISLDRLNEQEMTSIEQFLLVNQGAFETFSFTDPRTGTVYSDCSVVGDDFDFTFGAPLSGMSQIRIRQNRV